MKVEVVPLKAIHVMDIVERNLSEGVIQEHNLPLDELITAYLSPGSVAYAILINDIPAFCGGIINLSWRRGEAWMINSTLWFKYRKTGWKIIKQMLPGLAIAYHFKRVQAVSYNGDNPMFRHLGFEKEGRLRAYGPENQDCTMYSRVS